LEPEDLDSADLDSEDLDSADLDSADLDSEDDEPPLSPLGLSPPDEEDCSDFPDFPDSDFPDFSDFSLPPDDDESDADPSADDEAAAHDGVTAPFLLSVR
jgi:hypothetical protein